MTREVEAVYENGVLRLLAPLPLKERQHVSVTISDLPSADPAEAFLDHEYMASIDTLNDDEPEPTLEEVRRALASIPGNLSDDVRAERDARG